MTGEEDYRTPIAESEQFYAGLKLMGLNQCLFVYLTRAMELQKDRAT